ncbi:DUF1877 family protein [Chitinophaga filiformis]|uniref:Uncharacterized protein n=1 Tax=Chitinophaga filiformis TaxID=104663 RepID=A0A1G8AF98_CHIFI|nr:DUF1877 family protein [Chitinophaga filiformis]SDH19571.1 protein of unknown function [Chitinophaga filiformis]
MGIDLGLIAIPLYKIIEKTTNASYYDDMWYEFEEPGLLEEDLLEAKANNNRSRVENLMDTIKDWHELLQTYPGKNPKPYRFFSRYRCYSTLGFLLSKHYNATGEPVFHFLNGGAFPALKGDYRAYLDIEEVLKISSILSTISFKQLQELYDYEEVLRNAYKPKGPELFHYIEEEYQELVSFFEHAAALKAYVRILYM